MRKLVEKAIPIIKKYEEDNIKNGYGNNIYSLLNAERDEVMTHEETIYTIFQNQYRYEIKQELFSAFMTAMELDEKYSLMEWDLEKDFVKYAKKLIDIVEVIQEKGKVIY